MNSQKSFITRCIFLGVLWAIWQVCSSIYILDGWPSPMTWLRIASAGGVAFVGGCLTYARDPEQAWGRLPGVGKMLLIFALIAALAGLSGCTLHQAQNMDEWVKQTRELGGSGCTYVRGNARPYADVSMLTIVAWGKNAPNYLDCLQGIPPDARSFLP